MPQRPDILKKVDAVTSGEASADEKEMSFDISNVYITNIIVQNDTTVCLFDAVIHPKSIPRADGITLFQHEEVRDAGKDIIWEGREWCPAGWRISIVAHTGLVAADKITFRVGSETE